ncbi:MAG: RluA family pseudouridine synthase [Oscillospiraceae bacterium]|nr:RluA family pseudouridine synthase [Oscillospiraceae bacterium]
MINIISFTADTAGERIDALLARNVADLSRSAAQRLIEEGAVQVNGASIKKNYKANVGDNVELSLPEPENVEIVPQDIPISVVFEDDDVIVINKKRGMVVHPAPGHPDGTLVNALLHHCGDSLSGIGGEKRPGIVHRIDMDTSGLLIVAKNDYAHRFLSDQLSDHSLYRVYEAVVYGRVKDDFGTVDAPIGRHPVDRKRMAIVPKGGREAVTHYEVINRYRGYTHIRCRLETGRTHQIRVHMEKIGHPLVGDMVYGRKRAEKGLEGQCLHARELRFIHPRTEEEVRLSSELPDYFKEVLSKLGEPEN